MHFACLWMVSEWSYACFWLIRKPAKHGELKLPSNSYVWIVLNLQVYCIPVDLVKYYKNTALLSFFVSFYISISEFYMILLFLKQEFCHTLLFGRTEGDAWAKALLITFQINKKMFPIKINIWITNSWLTRKEAKSGMLLGCVQCKLWEESVIGKKLSVPRSSVFFFFLL